jgi:hypothetical protein
MTQNSRLEELLLHWEECRDRGRPVAAEDLCRACPELMPELQRRIQALQAMDRVLSQHDAATTPPPAARAADLDVRLFGEIGMVLPPSRSRFAAGTRVGPYCLQELLGRGAFGEVWLAERDSAIATSRLAVKLPLPVAADLTAIRKEAELWVRAGNHPNVLPLFEANVYDGQVVIVPTAIRRSHQFPASGSPGLGFDAPKRLPTVADVDPTPAKE